MYGCVYLIARMLTPSLLRATTGLYYENQTPDHGGGGSDGPGSGDGAPRLGRSTCAQTAGGADMVDDIDEDALARKQRSILDISRRLSAPSPGLLKEKAPEHVRHSLYSSIPLNTQVRDGMVQARVLDR